MKLRTLTLLLLFISFQLTSFAQSKDVVLPENWYNLDLAKDGYFGISTEKAYQEILKGKIPKSKIIVAVIDGGVEPNHEDLKGVMWVNQKEIPDNGIDDDGNGYIDDINGWNFIGSKKGNLAYDNLELIRIYRKLNPKYRSTIKSTKLDSVAEDEFALYNKVTSEFGKKYDDADQNFRVLSAINKVLDSVATANKKIVPTLVDIENYTANDEMEEQVKKIIRTGSRRSKGFDKFYKEVKDAYRQYDIMLRYNLNPKYDQRAELVGDDYENSNERNYGNSDVMGPNADHGTHVSGIIGAKRNNNIGINGIADQVSIMAIRVVPEGDERDKDVANGIRYAVDNGARIINMSFGKSFKWDKKVVDEAVKYAESKDVLLVHAAGNDNQNIDKEENYPSKYFESPEALAYQKKHRSKVKNIINEAPKPTVRRPYDGANVAKTIKKIEVDTAKFNLPHAKNWIEVGASAYRSDADLKASFSNYGKYNVDVFAPGFMIKSAVPKSKYEEFDGTSMAAPVVSGMAAVILSYYPELKAHQVRDIIIKSVVKVDHKVKLRDEFGTSIKVPFSELCNSAGVANLYNALKVAETYK
ncbi:S8 family serine peptidase [Pedobacter immunditicola]|uniref:S8 family serine peptidase n=1 Tax=Pedobacter immunditicola TaxID=3133440 RepID=UPI0030B2B38A